jgi:SPP1 gp7 family putative phage head morphogenesis protein
MKTLRTNDATNPPLSERFVTLRKARQEARGRFFAGRRAETQYARQLRQVAQQIGHIVNGMAPDGIVADVTALVATLNRYSDILRPWAESVASRMIADVTRRDAAAWEKHGKIIGRALKVEIANAPTGQAMRARLAEQVELIASLPRDAAERVHRLTTEAITKGTRASEIAKEIMASGDVSKSRAMLIARTEVSRTASALTIARAKYIGATHYTWETSNDSDVRLSHKDMKGKVIDFDKPPTVDGMTGHAGEFPNCRCFINPILD